MTFAAPFRHLGRAAVLLSGSALVSGCFLQPGTFVAEMNVREDGRFTFSYEGEIVMAGLGDLADMADQMEADTCTDDETFEERACTEAELAEREREEAQGRAMMQAMMSGTDLSNPETAAALAANLERQAGWHSVDYREDGIFEVSFSIDSQLGHDFDFPTIEGMPMNNSFVTARLRDGRRVRIEAP